MSAIVRWCACRALTVRLQTRLRPGRQMQPGGRAGSRLQAWTSHAGGDQAAWTSGTEPGLPLRRDDKRSAIMPKAR
jgi:hypothetical protein